jgi:hypothetical protein
MKHLRAVSVPAGHHQTESDALGKFAAQTLLRTLDPTSAALRVSTTAARS